MSSFYYDNTPMYYRGPRFCVRNYGQNYKRYNPRYSVPANYGSYQNRYSQMHNMNYGRSSSSRNGNEQMGDGGQTFWRPRHHKHFPQRRPRSKRPGLGVRDEYVSNHQRSDSKNKRSKRLLESINVPLAIQKEEKRKKSASHYKSVDRKVRFTEADYPKAGLYDDEAAVLPTIMEPKEEKAVKRPGRGVSDEYVSNHQRRDSKHKTRRRLLESINVPLAIQKEEKREKSAIHYKSEDHKVRFTEVDYPKASGLYDDEAAGNMETNVTEKRKDDVEVESAENSYATEKMEEIKQLEKIFFGQSFVVPFQGYYCILCRMFFRDMVSKHCTSTIHLKKLWKTNEIV